jgi:hypothetical protein
LSDSDSFNKSSKDSNKYSVNFFILIILNNFNFFHFFCQDMCFIRVDNVS